MIKVSHLNKYFFRRKKNEIHVLNDVSVDFPSKGLVVLLGASGSGKTTLLNVIGGLDSIQGGDIQFDDQIIKKYKANLWDSIRNEYIGYIFQNYYLLPELSVYDNIAFVLKMIGITDPAEIEKRVHYMLNAVKMYPFRKKKGMQLSGGQQQRVAIARALVKNPKVIIADEPTGNLDSANTLEVMNIIKSISKEKLVILVTHEKELASFYGNRIIEIKDGKIIADYDNENLADHSMSKDDTIYLKDLNDFSQLEDEKIKLAYYGDHVEDQLPVNIKLIVKNKTLYIDVASDIKKIKLVDKESGFKIIDDHYQKKTREQLIETTFDTNLLSHDDLKRENQYMVSIKQTLLMALHKIAKTSRKGKLMLFSFLIAGAVIAFTISMLATVVVIKPEPYMILPKGYVSISLDDDQNMPSYESILALKNPSDDTFFMHTFGRANLSFLRPDGNESMLNRSSQIDHIEHTIGMKFVAGFAGNNINDIVVTTEFADQIIKNRDGQEVGIWTYEHLLYERIDISGVMVRIRGIVESELNLVYMSVDLMHITQTQFAGLSAASKNILTEENIVRGNLPEKGQIMISEQQLETFFFGLPIPISFPFVLDEPIFENRITEISGTFEHDLDQITYIFDVEDIDYLRYLTVNIVHVFSSEPKAIVNHFVTTDFRVNDVYEKALEDARDEISDDVPRVVGITSALIGFSALGFYFVIRSSLISRIYEVSVYRALGVRKKDIFRSFIVEIFVLTSVSTIIGYAIATLALHRLQDGLIGQLSIFIVAPLSIIAGLIVAYAINILVGILPVFMLLRKTPAQIISQYDI
jgi:putative ABC transport system permease protein